jgi:cytochrome c6
MISLKLFAIFYSFSLFSLDPSFVNGKKIFLENCMVCHDLGKNIIIPEKNLTYDALSSNSLNSLSSLSYQIINGKNGMPAFGGRLKQNEVESVAFFILKNKFQN